MDQVPKILKPLVDEWTPEGFIVSFKVGPSIPSKVFIHAPL
jgi:phosphopantothenate-cysteine ligase